jgi:glycosyltransferase involved in cell wall biosynthesis
LLYLSTDEGMGLPPLEALARGCAVVCSDIPIFREVCGDAAFYVPLRDTDALALLVAKLARGELDMEIAKKLACGRDRIAQFGAVPLSQRWESLLNDYARWRRPVVI